MTSLAFTLGFFHPLCSASHFSHIISLLHLLSSALCFPVQTEELHKAGCKCPIRATPHFPFGSHSVRTGASRRGCFVAEPALKGQTTAFREVSIHRWETAWQQHHKQKSNTSTDYCGLPLPHLKRVWRQKKGLLCLAGFFLFLAVLEKKSENKNACFLSEGSKIRTKT